MLEEMKRRIASVLTSPLSPLPGIEVFLQPPAPEQLGADALAALLNLLGVAEQDQLVLGIYRTSAGPLIQQILGDPNDTLTLMPGTELDWDLWMSDRQHLEELLAHWTWPELIVDGAGDWLIWTEGLRSFLCDCRL